MRATILLAVFLVGCGAPRPTYGPGDPLAKGAAPELFSGPGASFSAVVPVGYSRSQAPGLPVAGMLVRTLVDGEADIVVERYLKDGPEGASPESFVENLGPKEPRRFLVRHSAGGKVLEAYHGMDIEYYARQIPSHDPYADSLGEASPPRLSLIERRRFPKGGDAYRLYRCRRLGAWGLLRDYRRGLKKGLTGEAFWEGLPIADRRIVAACFGQAAAAAMRGGAQAPESSKPSRYRLRVMARDEWEHGAARLVERECVHIRPDKDGFWVLRLRVPRPHFKREHESFEAFMGSFEPR